MKKGEVLYKHVKITDEVPMSKLGVIDMIRAIVETMNYDPASRFKSDTAYTEYLNTLKADLIKFLKKSIEPIQKGKKPDVLVELSSGFIPVYGEVRDSPLFEPYYVFKEAFPETIYPGIPYTFRVLIKRKEEDH